MMNEGYGGSSLFFFSFYLHFDSILCVLLDQVGQNIKGLPNKGSTPF
jgi:hypothetical protein